ncbi:recombinase family protein [Blautia sp. CLA-JM-H16]|uniref:Recombinase family protein n=1 Tax=Blautia aquisgranensis TaxID=3133153 RepID=A0ABV1BBF4_9FIRM
MNNRYMSNNIERNATWRVGVYCRLSKDDELTGESASISNQRDILVNYCQSQGWQVVDVFQDDGYTGLNTDRPDLQRLLKACEKGLVNLVITKDQSRLGRNHVQTGFLMEEFFPKHGVRYIALYDNVDTFAGDNEIAPFKNVLNEMYSRDISKKVHASYHLQATKGKFTGVVPPLGYQKDPENGKYVWDESYLKSLLMNPVYCGDMASQKRYYRFKIGNQGDKAPEDWITVRDTHEAIIPQDVFDLVQAKMKGRKRQTEQGEYSMFAGLLRCAECGGALTLKKTHTKDQHEVYTCSTYIHKGKAHCTQHRVDADDLYDAVLTRIQECAKAVTGDGTELENRVKELCEEDTQGHRESLEKLVSKQKDRLETLDRLIAKLYDDLINDKITESVFDKMLEKTQKEQTDIKKELFQNESVLNTEEKLDAQSQQWIDDISEYADIKELDANLLNRLISKIVISEPQEKDGTENYCRTPETVTMEIHFNLKPIPELGTIERGSGSHK